MDTQTKLGKTQLNINRIGFGGIPIQRLSYEESDRVVQKAVDAGINFFDTSRIYSDSEEKLGRILAGHRKKVVIASKTFSRDGDAVKKDLETSLKQLGTECIELMQCHNIGSPNELDQIMAPGGALEALEQALQEGKIQHIGITGHKPPLLLEALKKYPFSTVQVPLNIIETGALQELIPYARSQNIGTIAMKPVAGGALQNVKLNLRFILANGIDVAIPGMDKEEQINENLSILENLSPLTKKELEILENEKKALDENFCRRCEYCMPCPEGLPISFLHTLSAYYFRYNLKDWAWNRIQSLPKSYQDCTGCNECIGKCPYDLDNPSIFQDTWKRVQEDRGV